MQLSKTIAALVVLFAPAAVMAQTEAPLTETTTVTSYAATVTRTLIQVNATSTMHYTSTTDMSTTLYTASSYNSPTLSTTSASSTSPITCENCMGNGASLQQTNLALAAVAGAAALFWSSL